VFSRLVSRTLRYQGRKFTMRLEPEFWSALEDIAGRQSVSLGELLASVGGAERSHTGAARVYALQFFREMTAGSSL
jgi:predicted DNA-binding ribbon-helix-helix protein